MSVIVDIAHIKRNKKKFEVKLDNGFSCFLIDEMIVKYHLKTNKEISEEQLLLIALESEKSEGFSRALHSLERTTKTEREMRQFLKKKQLSDVAIDAIIEKLKEYNYIKDSEYAKQYVSYASKSKGKRLLAFELKNKGVKQSLIEQATSMIEDESEVVKQVATKFMRTKTSSKENIAKLFRHLLSKGFEYSDIKTAIKEMNMQWEDEHESWN